MGKVLLTQHPFALSEPSGTQRIIISDGEGDAATDQVRMDFTEIEGTDFFRVDVFAYGAKSCGQTREYEIRSQHERAPFDPVIQRECRALGATFWYVPGFVPHELHIYVGE